MAGTYPPITLAVNKFIATMTNLIAYSQYVDTLETGTINRLIASSQDINVPNGDGKLVLAADIIDPEDYSATSSLLESNPPTVKEQYIPVTNYKVIPLTVNKYLMRGAFAEESAMAGFIAYLYSIMERSRDVFLYNELVKMYDAYAPTNAGQTVTVSLIQTSGLKTAAEILAAKTENSNRMYEALINTLAEMGADSADFNDLSLTEVIDYKSLKFIGNSEFNTQMLVGTLATLLNSDKITEEMKWSETIIIPKGKLTTSGATCIGWLCHKKKIQFGYFYTVATSFFDGSNLNQNNWLHFAYYMDEVDALPCVKFVASYAALPAGG